MVGAGAWRHRVDHVDFSNLEDGEQKMGGYVLMLGIDATLHHFEDVDALLLGTD